jgi:uncharacterized membrane protein
MVVDAAGENRLSRGDNSWEDRIMANPSHLWAVGYENIESAQKARDAIARLGWETADAQKYLLLMDIVVVERHADGTFAFDRKPMPGLTNILACAGAGLLAGLVLAAPVTGAAIGALLGGAGTAATHIGIDKSFIRDTVDMIRPGTSALFVLDEAGNMDVILHAIQGLGGTVLRSNVDLERAKLIQAALAEKKS